MTRRTESACPAGKHEEVLLPTAWTLDACNATHRIAAGEISLNDILDYRTEMAVFLLEAKLIFLKKPQ